MSYFLDETDATHIWWIDTDMGFAPDTVENLLQTGKDVVGALCKGMDKVRADGFGGYVTEEFITAYDIGKFESDIVGFTLKQDLDLDSCDPIQVAATGTGCLLISRVAAMAVRNLYGSRWFERVGMTQTREIISEDLSFCYRLATLGIPVYVHPKIKTTHAKTVWLQ